MRPAGLDVELTLPPALPELHAAASLAAYRIVQESLTNVIKHSAATTATVTLADTPAGLAISVLDPGPARTSAGAPSGHGLIGLRERVRLVGGTIETGSVGAGYRVHALLPTGAGR